MELKFLSLIQKEFMIPKTFVAWRIGAALPILLMMSALSYAVETTVFDVNSPLSSTQLVKAVLSKNPTLPAMQATWEAANTRIDQEAALDDPLLSYRMAPQTIGESDVDFGQKIELSQKIPWPGKLHLRGQAAEYGASAAYENVNSMRLQLSARAKMLFAEWYFIHEAIRINHSNQKLLKEFRIIALSRYSTGLGSSQDALSADVEFNLLKHQELRLQREKRGLLTNINTLLNRTPDEAIPLPHELPEPPILPSAKSLRVQAIESRPELKAQAARIQEFKTLTDLAKREFYPDFNLSAGYNSLWDRDEKRFTIGVGVNLPLDQSKRRAAEAEARAKLKQAEWDEIDQLAKIAEEVQVAYDKVEESRQVIALYRNQLVPLAEENMEAAKLDYRTGSGDFLTLISSEKNLMQTQLQVERALTDAHRRLAELERAVGSIGPLSAEASSGLHQP